MPPWMHLLHSLVCGLDASPWRYMEWISYFCKKKSIGKTAELNETQIFLWILLEILVFNCFRMRRVYCRPWVQWTRQICRIYCLALDFNDCFLLTGYMIHATDYRFFMEYYDAVCILVGACSSPWTVKGILD
jgi:hypothetical protein